MNVITTFKNIALDHPDRIAVKYFVNDNWQDIKYRELFFQAGTIAKALIDSGVALGDSVILPSQRTPHLCAQLLGVLWVGANYVFLDTKYPLKRQQLICSDTKAKIGLYENDQDVLTGLPIKWIKIPEDNNFFSSQNKDHSDPPDILISPERPAYVVFTSGSTGTPKGVVVPHRGITRLVLETDYMDFSKEQSFLQLNALSFDVSALDIWGPLLNGGCCVLYPENETPNSHLMKRTIEECGVTTVVLTTSLYNTIISQLPECFSTVSQIIMGGEVCSVAHINKGLKELPNTKLYNAYGPSENTVITTIYSIPQSSPQNRTYIPIGYSIKGTYCEVFNENLQRVEDNTPGELIVFGDGVALEYLNYPEKTAEKFINLKCKDGVTRTGYRTGDLVIRQTDGCFKFIDRIDKQVKIDGHRIEPEEIDSCLNQLNCIDEARVVLKVGPKGQKRLAAYYVCNSDIDRSELRTIVSNALPSFMVPHFFIQLPELPKNTNGKLDESQLPDPFTTYSPNLISQNLIADCWYSILGRHVDENDNFLDAGGTSLEALQLTELLSKHFHKDLESTFVFEYSTIQSQSKFFKEEKELPEKPAAYIKHSSNTNDIAVIGMACRMPGAQNVEDFWGNLLDGKESVSYFDQSELVEAAKLSDITHKDYVNVKGIIENCDQFDSAFFNISPVEAKIMDPQQRIMLELAWHALEDAGMAKDKQDMRVGVFAGMNFATYFQQYILNNDELKNTFGLFNLSVANESDFLCSRISHKLNLTGPSINVFTACSTSLVAIAQACANIERNECEAALAGGVSITTPVKSGYLYQEGNIFSKDGHCRPFDQYASGTTFNDGAGFVVLKRRDIAEQNGDHIYAIIKGYAVNNDGKDKASFSAPSVSGQVQVYDAALASAGVAPESIGYIETHGTATPLGDPIEVKALSKSYSLSRDNERETCAIGSVKSNIGHVVHAAGVASFIKTVKAVETGVIPATLHFSKPNPKLEIEQTPFFVTTTPTKWRKNNSKRRAAISSLGVGGTNAHVIIEEYNKVERQNEKTISEKFSPPHPTLPIFLSAKSQTALDLLIDSYQNFFSSMDKGATIEYESYNSLYKRQAFPFRAAVTGRNAGEIAISLKNKKYVSRGKISKFSESKIGFMFSGQGSQRKFMGKWLYENHDEYRKLFDRGSQIIKTTQDIDLHSILFKDNSDEFDSPYINQTKAAQPALFLFEYGLAQYLFDCGCKPDFLLGHSIGEFTAAALAGVFSFEDAVKIVGARGALMQSCMPGKMLAVQATEKEISSYITNELSLAAINAPDRVVLSGAEKEIASVAEKMKKNNIGCSLLHTSHAFHSAMMEPIVEDFEAIIKTVTLDSPRIPIFSTATGKLLLDEEATSPSYWSKQIRTPVRFAHAVQASRESFAEENIAFVEVGPGNVLSTLLGCQNTEAKNPLLSSAPSCCTGNNFVQEFGSCLVSMWTKGVNLDWPQFFKGFTPKSTKLPQYIFEPAKHWLEIPQNVSASTKQTATLSPLPQITQVKKKSEEMKRITMSIDDHKEHIEKKIRTLLEKVSGFDLGNIDADDHFSEIGLDSLLLTQAATVIDREFSVDTTFRHLVEEFTSIALLRDFIAEKVPPETKEVPVNVAATNSFDQLNMGDMQTPMNHGTSLSNVEQLINQQLQIMQLQLKALQSDNTATALPNSVPELEINETRTSPPSTDEKIDTKKTTRHTPGTRISKEKVGSKLSNAQKEWLENIMRKYQRKFASSKEYTQEHRKYFSDPRSVSGFGPEWKEIIFPIVTDKSKGSKIWDIDGNELIDITNGFGPILFGHSPDFVTDAVKKQIEKGIETGPQTPLAGEVAKLFCELTGNERCTFASTGSEAVAGALRIARTVTGREKIVMFEGSYHGIFDEVINRPGKDFQALPAAPGIPREKTSNMVILPWADYESLEVIRKMGPELAAVLVEPVQSRHLDFHDPEYLKKIREITEESGTALILDEVVTGFRVHPGGIRKLYEIESDIATYGKVVGGGYPIGIIGGKAKFMDALDGGYWEYGNDSIPECGVTFFAGTFVRHPIALTAAKAIMEKIQNDKGKIHKKLEETTSKMAHEAKEFIKQLACDVTIEHFGSAFFITSPANAHWGNMLFYLMTLEGIHTQQYRPNFLTTEHDDADVNAILKSFKKSLAELVVNGLIDGDMVEAKKFITQKQEIPEGARLGKNSRGESAYFIEDPNNKGNYLEVGKP